LDYIALHIYPVDEQSLSNAERMAVIAQKADKPIHINEAWLYKTAAGGEGNNMAAFESASRRDAYSFWQPLDKKFLDVLVKFADQSHAESISPYWSTYFFGVIDYQPRLERASYAQIRQLVDQAAIKNLKRGILSSTGEYYKQLIAEHPKKK
jgi:hypothetical protein